MIQALFLANYPEVLKKIAGRKPFGKQPGASRVRDILEKYPDDTPRQIEAVFLWTLARLPNAAEQTRCAAYLRESHAGAGLARSALGPLEHARVLVHLLS